ncbi:putative hydrolase of the HAD superfamily [Pelagirhabdus alkalitolerans]|uniref:Putative hydrolase of the HAD superfamily n=1 Tax=Pelagirhabdus alkalitolerans TaxID=1612202 RepID=A0A1G6GLH3_9BACI|nr:HAD family hydrolase [Pelagirhabdus alkalitolerans]SDB82827.1 putative hydrolase of the HAD superfamily [Pelagirhabdus alkalitolerans]
MHTVVFDVDDTLYDQQRPFKQAFKRVLSTQFTDQQLAQLYIASRKYSDQVFEKEQRGEISTLDLQIYRIQQATKDFNFDITEQQAIEFQDAYLEEQKQITLFPEMKDVLDILKERGIQMAVLTNGNTEHQQMKIDQLNLTNWIKEEHCFISGSIGAAKPELTPFQHIENRLTIDRDSTWYIGDSFENDVLGAKGAGWRVIWFNHRKRQAPKRDVFPDQIIEETKDLVPFFTANLLTDS